MGLLGVFSMVSMVGAASEDRAKIGAAQVCQMKIQRSRVRHARITGKKSPLLITAARRRNALRGADRAGRSRGRERRQVPGARDRRACLADRPRSPRTLA